MNNTPIVAVTGAPACGKSYVTRTLCEQLGRRGLVDVHLFDYDAKVKELLADNCFTDAINRAFPERRYGVDHEEDTAWARRVIIFDPKNRKRLDAVVQPMMLSAFTIWKNALAGGVVVLDMPLLFESEWDIKPDLTLCVVRPEYEQHTALLERGLSEEEALSIVQQQFSQAVKACRSDVVLYNRTGDNPAQQVGEVVNEFLTKILTAEK